MAAKRPPRSKGPVLKIGVDVGGTNTDAVVLDGERIVGWAKSPTTEDVGGGIVHAIGAAMADADCLPGEVQCVMIGTTQFTNAVIERRHLQPVGVLRLCLPAAAAVPPLTDWPDELAAAVGSRIHMVRGGFEFDGREIAPLDEKGIAEIAREFRAAGLKTVAVTSVFSPVNDRMERRAEEILRDAIPDVKVSLSGEIGQFGVLQRENSNIINASLTSLADRVVSSFRGSLASLGLDVPFYISQNDGTLMDGADVARYPVLTFASGPTNSMRGAARLAGVNDAMVVDIGGTTSDIGMLRQGFPRQSTYYVDVGGVMTNFRMPDVLAIGLGGGSIVRDDGRRIGPDSVGFHLTREAIVFGGSTLTASDIAVAGGWADFGDRARVSGIPAATVANARICMQSLLDENIDRMKTDARQLPIVVVGGGAVLVDWSFKSGSEIVTPDYGSVANAVGAAIAQVAGEVDKVIAISEANRERVIEDAKAEAIANAIRAGAIAESVDILEVEQIPISYLPGNPSRLRVKAVGDLPTVPAIEN